MFKKREKGHSNYFIRKARNNSCSFGKCPFTGPISKYYKLQVLNRMVMLEFRDI